MPINFDLEKIRQEHNCKNYFETGLWDPREDVSSKYALNCNFDKVFCVEIRKDWVELGNEVFKEQINKNRYFLYNDDSSNLHKYLDNKVFNEKTIFFLDAHVDNKNIKNYKLKCPLFDELNSIKNLERKDNLILIDDLRILKKKFPWGEKSFGKINFLEQIKNIIMSINKNYKFKYLNGHIENDILYAYV